MLFDKPAEMYYSELSTSQEEEIKELKDQLQKAEEYIDQLEDLLEGNVGDWQWKVHRN